MTFLHPLLLWGALLGSIPIIIHLLSRRRYRVMPWAAMEFLLAALSERSRNVRIQDMILLALRVLVLVVAAGAVARPLLAPSAAGMAGLRTGGPDAVIILDTSYSMQTNVAGQTRMDHARQRAQDVLQALPEHARIGVLYMDERATPAMEGLTDDRLKVAAAIDTAEPTALGSDAVPAMRAAMEMMKTSTAASKRVFLITDAQSRLFERQEEALRRVLQESDPALGFVVLTVPNAPAPNLAVTRLAVKNRALRAGAAVQFEADIIDYGAGFRPARVQAEMPAPEPAAEASAELWIDGRKIDRLAVPLVDRRATASFQHVFAAPGLYAVEVRLDPDAVAIDNHRYLAVNIPAAIDVAVVGPEGPLDSGDSSYLYLEAALGSAGPPSDRSTQREDEAEVMVYNLRPHIPRHRLAAELDDRVQVLILADPGALPADGLRRLEDWIRDGGSVLIASGPEATATLGAFRSGQDEVGTWLSDLTLGGETSPEAGAGSGSLQLDLDDVEQMAGFAEQDGGDGDAPPLIDLASPGLRGTLARVNIQRAVTVEPAGDSRWSVAMRLTDGRPALLTRQYGGGFQQEYSESVEAPRAATHGGGESPGHLHVSGSGRLVLFTSTLDPRWNDMVYRPAFVALTHDLLAWLIRHRTVSPIMPPARIWQVGPRGLDDTAALSGLRVVTPSGETLDAEAFLTPADAGGWAFEQTAQPGVYRLESAGGGAPGPHGEDALHAVAVNVDTAGSDPAVWTPQQIRTLFPKDRCEIVSPQTPIDQALLAGLSGMEIWPILAMLVLLLIVAETLLGYRFSFQKKAEATAAAAPRAAIPQESRGEAA